MNNNDEVDMSNKKDGVDQMMNGNKEEEGWEL